MSRFWEKVRTSATRLLAGKHSRRAMALFLFCGALAFMGLVILRDWETLVAFEWQFSWGNIVGLVLLHSMAMGSLFLSWHLMMRRLASQRDWRGDFSIYSLSLVARRIPTPLWYIGGRVFLYQQRQVPAAMILTASGLEAALIALSGIVCYFLIMPWYSYTQKWSWPVVLASWAALTTAFVFRPNLLVDLVNGILRLLGRPPLDVTIARTSLALWGLIYLTTWLLDGIGLYYALSALLPMSPPLADVVGISTISALVGIATLVLPGGFGLKELTMSALLGVWIPFSTAITISIFYRLSQTLIEGFWALVGHWAGRPSSREVEVIIPD